MWAVLLPWTQRHSVASFMPKASTFATAGSRGAPRGLCGFGYITRTGDLSCRAAAGPIRIHAVSSRQALSAVLQRPFDREFLARPFFPENFGQEIFEPLAQWLMRFEF